MDIKSASITVILMILLLLNCGKKPSGPEEITLSSRSYKGHQSDADANNFIAVYPNAVGTRLDDCILCHTNGHVEQNGKTRFLNAYDYCHHIKENGLALNLILNSYGAAYDFLGRNQNAIESLHDIDCDGDSYANGFSYHDDQFTFGVNYYYKNVKVQLNYIHKNYEALYFREIANDLFALNVQIKVG